MTTNMETRDEDYGDAAKARQDKRLADALLRSLPEMARLISENKQMRVALEEAAQRLDARGHKFGADQARAAISGHQQSGSKE